MTLTGILTIIAILLSPVIALIIGQKIVESRRKKDRKEEVLRKLISYRHIVHSDEFLSALNSVPIIFREDEKIKKLHKYYFLSNKNNALEGVQKANLVALILAVCNDLGYGKNVEYSDIEDVFSPKTNSKTSRN